MLIYALDDESFLLAELEKAISEAEPTAEIHSFSRAKFALQEMDAKKHCPDVAFLDIEMPGMSGLELAKYIKDRSPNTNIIFVTGYHQYALEAHTLHPSGYVMKPATANKIRKELDNLRHPIERKSDKRVRVQCFGHFEVFVDDAPMKFKYNKTKELFAYLIDRKGATISTGELMGILWEDKPGSLSMQSYLRNLITDLSRALREAGTPTALIKDKRCLAVDTKLLDCDYYGFINRTFPSVNTYRGEYMTQYSWAEMTLSGLEQTKS